MIYFERITLFSVNIVESTIIPSLLSLKVFEHLTLGSIDPLEARQVFYFILMRQSQERNVKPFSAAYGYLGWLCPISVTYKHFLVPKSQFKNRPNPRR